MTELALFLILAGFLGLFGLLLWRLGQIYDRIEELEDRADSHEAALLEINPGWMP